MRNTQWRNRSQVIADLTMAASTTLHALEDMTSNQFAAGEDGPLREDLAKALGYDGLDDWRENKPAA